MTGDGRGRRNGDVWHAPTSFARDHWHCVQQMWGIKIKPKEIKGRLPLLLECLSASRCHDKIATTNLKKVHLGSQFQRFWAMSWQCCWQGLWGSRAAHLVAGSRDRGGARLSPARLPPGPAAMGWHWHQRPPHLPVMPCLGTKAFTCGPWVRSKPQQLAGRSPHLPASHGCTHSVACRLSTSLTLTSQPQDPTDLRAQTVY